VVTVINTILKTHARTHETHTYYKAAMQTAIILQKQTIEVNIDFENAYYQQSKAYCISQY
jgi:hypothetical protein